MNRLLRLGGVTIAGWLALTLSVGLARRRMHTWGSTAHERLRSMTADAFVEHPRYRTDLAVTIDARPSDIWPWLAQMGYQRGGFYSYDRLDRLFGFLDRPSASAVLPQFQDLTEGDVIPTGKGRDFPVKLAERERDLVMAGEEAGTEWSWELALYPGEGGMTRLISRNRVNYPRTLAGVLTMAALEPAAFLMTRRMLLNLKARAEGLALERQAAEDRDGVAAAMVDEPARASPPNGQSGDV